MNGGIEGSLFPQALNAALMKHFGPGAYDYDAFARLRVSNPYTLFDSKQIFNDPDLASNVENLPLYYDNQEISGTGTATMYNTNESSTTLSVTANTAGHRVRQTRQRFNYQPGKSQLIMFTFSFEGVASSGITKREGYFDENDGLFFQEKDGGLSFVVRSAVSGTPVDTEIAQNDFNVDRLDGRGDSKETLNLDYIQVGFIYFSWQGAGTTTIGFFINGRPIIAHRINSANVNTLVYMRTPNLPIRTELINDGNGPAAEITQICSTVISEGGIDPTGTTRGIITGATAIKANTPGTWYAVAGIRLKAEYIGETVPIESFSIINTSNDPFFWQICFNPTVAGTFTYNGVAQSAIEYAVGDTAGNPSTTTVTNTDYCLQSGVTSDTSREVRVNALDAIRLGSLIDGTPDEIVLMVMPLTLNANIHGAINWREI